LAVEVSMFQNIEIRKITSDLTSTNEKDPLNHEHVYELSYAAPTKKITYPTCLGLNCLEVAA